VPPEFPLLLVAPALLIDLAMQRLGRGRDWRLSALIAIASSPPLSRCSGRSPTS
jgi:hypothetical protein